jgi:primosomal protein N' (replication factor Y)
MSRIKHVASFAINLPVFHLFDYQLDEQQPVKPGRRFLLPFANGHKTAVLVATREYRDADQGLKSAGTPLDVDPVISEHLLDLGRWLAEYYCQPIGEVIFQLLPRYLRGKAGCRPVSLSVWLAASEAPQALPGLERRAPRQHALLAHLLQYPQGLLAPALREFDQNWRGPLKSLQTRGLVESRDVEPVHLESVSRDQPPPLSDEQQAALGEITARKNRFRVELLQGVTGSGKTEVYLALMQQVIDQGGQAIYLVPEIGLTPQLLQRVRNRLGPVVVASHSAQTEFQRYQAWDQFRRGSAKVILGTRSALFSEARKLALLIIDEEHDASYRQQDGVRYHARDVAIKRAQSLDIPVVLGSATPSTETLFNLERPHFYRLWLRQRPGNVALPGIQAIDCSRVELDHGCSPQLLRAMGQQLAQGGQVLLFLNRRGFAPVVMCHQCGWQSDCHQCDARMTLHQSVNRLICHHCGFSQALPPACPQCGDTHIRHHGVGTEQLQQFIEQRFAPVPVIRIDRDSVASAGHMEHLMAPVRSSEPCVLVGTQMLAKGHDYPHITLVGILDVDQALFSGFYRAGERLAQTVLQVAGRAGRSKKPGRALLQTSFPQHPLMQLLTGLDYDPVIKLVLDERRLVGFPPFVRAVTLVADGRSLDEAMQVLEGLRQALDELPPEPGVRVAGPIPALMTRRIGRYRAQLSLFSASLSGLRSRINQLLPDIRRAGKKRHVRLVVEVDPQDL